MNKIKCPRCESRDIHITEYPNPTDSMATCYGCGYAGSVEQLPKQSFFDHITVSMDVLAEKFVIKECNRYGGSSYKAILLIDENGNYRDFYSREKAIAATVERLKEVYSG